MVRHIIHRQKIILNLSKREHAGALQASVSNLMQHDLKAGIDVIFNNAFPEDKIIRIDKLQLNLGTINQQNFENEFKAQLLSELAKGLSQQKDNLSYADSAEELNREQSLINALIYFLEKGYLPWYQAITTMDDWETEILNNFTDREYQQFFSKVLLKQHANEVVVQRLILQFSDKFLGRLLSGAMPEFDFSWELIYNDMALVIHSFVKHSTTTVRNRIWQYILQALPDRRSNDISFHVLNKLSVYFGISGSDITPKKESKIISELKTNIIQSDFKKLIVCLKQKVKKDHHKKNRKSAKNIGGFNEDQSVADDVKVAAGVSTDPVDEGTILSGTDTIPDSESAAINEPDIAKDEQSSEKKEKPKPVQRKKDAQIIAGDMLFVNNSGTIILHPFLKAYFESLGLLAEKKFISDEACQRAVLLLHYLATGETKVAEFNLTLQKVMCGYPLDDTLPDEIRLTEKEITESENLLGAVTNYWVPLNNTSIQGLRSSFLQREGKLELRENGWLLTIEQKTLDILLGKLPWGISTIRLPWMEQLLNVDWY
ncbi:hypothetical protein SAMN05216490_4148 [Mucilaginibacter mallensis]|uniref:Uncharacterized protein n=1 Tax=Mucilaginibacter mallensis TaxID=652787 RepID=A0A1H2BJ12_MUCMA|nr:contractile injection system tape measure protein [Mucilaginibacter mallensis]SDT58067.1 hypothetical protein SAMN05216490_4148 [Mucilaginibacter mallensis]